MINKNSNSIDFWGHEPNLNQRVSSLQCPTRQVPCLRRQMFQIVFYYNNGRMYTINKIKQTEEEEEYIIREEKEYIRSHLDFRFTIIE